MKKHVILLLLVPCSLLAGSNGSKDQIHVLNTEQNVEFPGIAYPHDLFKRFLEESRSMSDSNTNDAQSVSNSVASALPVVSILLKDANNNNNNHTTCSSTEPSTAPQTKKKRRKRNKKKSVHVSNNNQTSIEDDNDEDDLTPPPMPTLQEYITAKYEKKKITKG